MQKKKKEKIEMNERKKVHNIGKENKQMKITFQCNKYKQV